MSGLGHELCWVGAKDASGSGRSSDSTHAAALELVDGTLVVSVDDCCSTHGTKDLCQHVDRELPPWEFSEDAVGESDSGIQVSTGNTRCVDTQHDTKTPAPGSGKIVSMSSQHIDVFATYID